MPLGTPRTETERRERHERIYGGFPPEERLGLGPKYESLGEVVYDALPATPFEFGPLTLPLPRGIMRALARSVGHV